APGPVAQVDRDDRRVIARATRRDVPTVLAQVANRVGADIRQRRDHRPHRGARFWLLSLPRRIQTAQERAEVSAAGNSGHVVDALQQAALGECLEEAEAKRGAADAAARACDTEERCIAIDAGLFP